jgi:hypothetical protein
MTGRCHLEKLRAMLATLQQDAANLYQYGNLTITWDVCDSINDDDKKRLVALALIEGDEDVKNTAGFLMGKLFKLSAGNLDKLILQMNLEDRQEMETIREQSQGVKAQAKLTISDRNRIILELQKACDHFGSLEFEEARWILIPSDPSEEATWISAMGGGRDDFYSSIAAADRVGYAPTEGELFGLLDDMKEAAWILHVHNHPASPLTMGTFFPSATDMASAMKWKSIRPGLEGKMKFFVIQTNLAIEYASEQRVLIQWI